MSFLLLIYLSVTLAVTEIFYRLIECPTMLLGRRLTAPRTQLKQGEPVLTVQPPG
jgi:peptidoglycan/LPS O-acetylase OafA/YrhL